MISLIQYRLHIIDRDQIHSSAVKIPVSLRHRMNQTVGSEVRLLSAIRHCRHADEKNTLTKRILFQRGFLRYIRLSYSDLDN